MIDYHALEAQHLGDPTSQPAHDLSGALYSNGIPLLTHYSEPTIDDEGNHPGTGRPYEPARKEGL